MQSVAGKECRDTFSLAADGCEGLSLVARVYVHMRILWTAYLCVTRVIDLQVCLVCAWLLLSKPSAHRIDGKLSGLASKLSVSFLVSGVVLANYDLGQSFEVHGAIYGLWIVSCEG